jgi:lipocalin
MQTLIVKTDSVAHAKFLSSFLKTVSFVKSVFIEPKDDSTHVVNEPDAEYNWINPSRPATDEEIEKMLDECEAEEKAGKYFTPEQVKQNVTNRLKEWRKKNSK